MANIIDDDSVPSPVQAAVALEEGVFGDGPEALKLAASVAGLTVEDFTACLRDEAFLERVCAVQAQRRTSGEAARSMARQGVAKATAMIAARLEDEETHLPNLIKAGEFLHKVSELGTEFAHDLRVKSGVADPQVYVLYDGEPAPKIPEGTPSLIIRIGSRPEAIEGEAKEVRDDE